MEWAGSFMMNKGIHTMIFSKVGGKYSSDSLFLAMRRQEIDEDLSLALQELGDSMTSRELEGCEEDHHDHEHGHRSLRGGFACIQAAKSGKYLSATKFRYNFRILREILAEILADRTCIRQEPSF